MGVSPLVAVVAVIIFFVAVALIWWLRFQEKKSVARNVSLRPHPYVGGRMANNIYRIPLSRNYIYQTPPPTFSKAVKYPVPTQKNRVSVINVYLNEEAPPPTYQQYLKTQELPGTHNTPSQQSHCSDFI